MTVGDEPDSPVDRPAADAPDGIAVRRATADDHVPVLRVIEGALLDVDPDRIRDLIAAGEALVAVSGAGTVVGTLVRDGEHVVAVAVHRRRRRQGIGRALVEGALGTTGRLTATFDSRVRGFYEALGFEVDGVPTDGAVGRNGAGDADGSASDRLWGVRRG